MDASAVVRHLSFSHPLWSVKKPCTYPCEPGCWKSVEWSCALGALGCCVDHHWRRAGCRKVETIYLIARHAEASVQPSPRAVSEGFARVGSRGMLERGVPGGRRMSPGLQNPAKEKRRGHAVLTLVSAGVDGQGQISKMMISRLEGQGLVENTRAAHLAGSMEPQCSVSTKTSKSTR
jgi:hypothetical protein